MSQAYVNGELVDESLASVSIFDTGLMHGVGLFETMRAYGGQIAFLYEHLRRLMASAQELELRIDHSVDELQEAIQRVVRANGLSDARVRLTITPGNPFTAGDDQAPANTVIVTATEATPYPTEYYQKGASVIISPYKQNPYDATAGHKTLNYFPRLRALQAAQKAGAIEALWFTTTNRLAEGCISNVFLVKEGELITPPLDVPVLPGVVRQQVLKLAQQEGVEISERECVINDVLQADEIFLTNSMMELMPVCRVERHAVADEKPGDTWRRLHQAYKEQVRMQ